MSQWALKCNGKVVPRRTCRPLTTAELHSDIEKKKRKVFDDLIEGRWGTSINPKTHVNSRKTSHDDCEECEDEDEEPRIFKDIEDPVDEHGKAINQNPPHDKMINAELQLPHQGELQKGIVMKRATNPEGFSVGTHDDDPLKNSMVHEVQFPDGQVKEHAANATAENMLSQVDNEGHALFDGQWTSEKMTLL